ncbi:MAG TPA: ABC transporter substrate-binding protein, partial [Acidimicrobiales bacterium]|nr:ABC transporter substrate-binding protein [Acidimicrobiales bacterium]
MSWAWRAAVLAAAGAVAAGCASVASTTTTTSSTTTTTSGGGATTSTTGGPAVNGPGVTATQIDIGTIETKTGPLAGYFNGLSQGMIAYFNMINAEGGINGRKLELTANLDDGGSSTQFTQDVHTLIDQDHVFAVGVASAWFTPDYFVSTKTPTYGYNVSGNWETAPNLFAAGGSTQIYSSGISTIAYFVKEVKATKIAVISYGKAIASSYDACTADAAGLKSAGYDVVLVDVSAGLNGTFSSDVQRMRSAGADLIISCMQASDNITLARDVQEYGLHAKQLWFNGYDQPLLNQYSNVMQGVYLNNT